jgi:GNAT superfamily N-acetyltransferase
MSRTLTAMTSIKEDAIMRRPSRSSVGSRRRRAAALTQARDSPARATDDQTAKRKSPLRAARVAGSASWVRRVRQADIASIIALDERVTGLAKRDYWQDIFERYGRRRLAERMFLVAVKPAAAAEPAPLLGFVVGEVRAWEFGSEPCGWVFALSVEPRARLGGVGQALLEALSGEFIRGGVTKMRTMVARDNHLHLLFFRSEGMTAGPYIQLEKDLA